MASKAPQNTLYADLEKFHRVIGYYEGQKIKPLEVHEKFINEDLERSLRAPDQYIRNFQFDLYMTHVLADQKEVFQTDKPDSTLLYNLFAEGIKSIIMLRDLTAREIKDWCILVRETLIALDAGQSKDLASVLWKTPFRNLRAKIYNSLMDLHDLAQNQADAEKVKSGWHERDAEWDLPSGESVRRSKKAATGIDETELEDVRKQLIGALKGEPSHALKINGSEVDLLSSEMASYDQSQVEFNLLCWSQSVLEGSFGCDPNAEAFVEDLILSITQSVIARFHPGLILHLLSEMDRLKTTRYEGLKKRVHETVSQTLSSPQNLKLLTEALRDEERSVIAERLFSYLHTDQFVVLIDHYLQAADHEGLKVCLKILMSRDVDLTELLTSWGEERLVGLFPLLRDLEWEDKQDFLIKMLRSKFTQVIRMVSQHLLSLSIRADYAYDLYRKYPEDIREIWIKQLLENPPAVSWRDFVQNIFSSNYWLNEPKRLRALWIRILFQYYGPYAFDFLEPWVAARKWIFWPKFPDIREEILTLAMDLSTPNLKQKCREWAEREAKLRFQDPHLKERLEIRAKQKT